MPGTASYPSGTFGFCAGLVKGLKFLAGFGPFATKPARADLKHIHDFIAEDSKHYAKKVAQEIREKTNILDRFPNIGKMVPEVNKPEVQELHIYSYRIMYEVKGDNRYVLAVIHQRQNFAAKDLP
ncbi:type II toxin-antitoxin system RelE/ParE family toxin [Sessilibacter sp. MAH4]